MKTTIIQDDSNEPKPERSETTEEVGVRRHPTNLSGRMGRWSAHHRKTAILGWLAFVVASFFVGSSVIGAKQATDTSGPGESGRALTILDDGFKQPAAESVLIQSETLQGERAGVRRRDTRGPGCARIATRGHEHPLPARPGERRSDLGRRPLGARRVPDPRRLRPRRRQDRSDPRSDRRGAGGTSPGLHRHLRRRQRRSRSSRGPSWTTSRRPASTRSRSR